MTEKKLKRRQFAAVPSAYTWFQIDTLMEWGAATTKTNLLSMLVDRAYREEKARREADRE